ncbi:hypothetical protein [Hymenobacter guriensis]|uniref:Uncharacterized protein n=1 Tax=Hymenobacter guriensis TaxID=2793065 RepID=A0ABS0L1U0_9BACT|nr:hypothetical protein [Hymenobacter guriensis]MBG8554071.1 hypothetical protein [Hymenobacter guriensis]
MHPAVHQNNVQASTIFWVSCLISLLRVGITMAVKMEQEGYGIVAKIVGAAIALALMGGVSFLVGLGLRKGYMWVKVLVLTINIIALLVYGVSLLPGAVGTEMLKRNYDTPLEAILLSLELLLTIGFIVAIFRGFGISDRASNPEHVDTVFTTTT